MKTVTGLFDTFDNANRAVNELINNGFSRDAISLVSSNTRGEYDPYFDKEGRYLATDPVVAPDIDAKERELVGTKPADGSHGDMTAGEGAAAGAGIGAAIGGLGGVLMGLGLLAIPGVGPALAAGAIVSGLVGAGIGGVAGGITGALANAGVPEDEVEYYAEGVRRGGHLVLVSTSDERSAIAQDILNRHNPVNVLERSEQWRKEGWAGFDPKAPPYVSDTTRPRDPNRL